MAILRSRAGKRAKGGREKYVGILRQLEGRYARAMTMEEYDAALMGHLAAVRRMRDRRALSRLDRCINSVLNARKDALERLAAIKIPKKQ
jgi:hypothetical protein